MSKSSIEEIEVKFTNINLDEIRQKLINAKAELKTPKRLMRRSVFGSEANNSMKCTYGRVRDEGDVVTMSAKYSAVNGDINSQKEVMITVDSYESGVMLLEAFGLIKTNSQENYRETWILNGVYVELEEWPLLSPYIEIEGESVEDLIQVAKILDLSWDEHTTDSTDKLYKNEFSWDDQELAQKISDLHF